MARPLRLELSGSVYHVTSRGDGREDIYLTDADRAAWLGVFGQVCERFNWVCHAWCQMTNHYHILIETPEAENIGDRPRFPFPDGQLCEKANDGFNEIRKFRIVANRILSTPMLRLGAGVQSGKSKEIVGFMQKND